MAKEQKQSIDLRPGKRFSTALSNENLRIGDSSAWEAKVAGTLDPTRTRLDFEVGKSGVIQPIDKSKSIPKRIKAILAANGIEDPNAKLDDEYLKIKGNGTRTFASFILQGSHDTMEKLAFGDQKVSYSPFADNSHLERKEDIEKWAKDMYAYIAQKYGEENIAEFTVHLDETTPHAHCVVVPITPSGKLSFRKVFVGENNNKYEFSKRTKAIWDEAGKIAEKYGMARGDDSRKTGAKHKSYLQWMREQIFSNQKKIEEQDETITRQSTEISEQKQQLYAINAEIKTAEKKLKSFTSMLNNLKEQKEQLEIEITALEDMRDNGNEEVEKQLKEKQQMLNQIIGKISDREKQLSNVQQQLYDLAIKKHDLQKRYDDMKRQMNKELPDLLDKTQREVNDTFWEMAAEEMKKDYSALEEFSKDLPWGLRDRFDRLLGGSFFEDLAQRGEQMAACAAALFLGYVDAATNIAHAGGGGGGNTSGWGRDKDEDDEAYRRRCCIMGRMMMKPAGRKLKR